MAAKKKFKKTLVLLDAHAILHRAYHAMPDFSSSKGEPTGALYGVSMMVTKIIQDFKPDYIAACFDLPKPTFRHEAYKAYKAGRAKTKDDLIFQIKRSRGLFEAFNIPIYDAEGFEADDLLGTIADELKSDKDLRVVIASGDMDTLQLVDGNRVVVFTLKKGINDTVIYNEDAVNERFGFGPLLLPDYKGLRGDPSDNIIGIKGIGDKTATIIITHFGELENMYEALHKDEKTLLDLGLTPRIVGLLRDGEDEALFSKMLATIRRDAPTPYITPETTWGDGIDMEKLEALFTEFEFRGMMARVKQSLGLEEKAEDKTQSQEEVPPEEFKRAQIVLWLINSELTSPTLDDIYTHTNTKTFEEAQKVLLDELKSLELESVFYDIELPLIPVLEAAEEKGVLINQTHFSSLSEKYHAVLETLEQNIWGLAGEEFNINSPKQLGVILFDVMDLSVKGLKKTAGGARSTRESELIKLKDEHEIIGYILEYREVQKMVSTYVDTIPKLADDTDRVHTNLNQTGTTTGRMSSSNPNMQNIPNRGDMGIEIRKGFIPKEGCVFLAFDYSQVEMRVLADLANDTKLIEIFNAGEDVHAAVAAFVFGVSEDEVTKDMRRQAKVINFGIVYGMGVTALKDNLKTTRKEAQAFYDNYFEKFPNIRGYFDSVKEGARNDHYTKTLFGRIRHFKNISSPIPFIKAMAERMAVNAPIQGTAADIIKIATIQADEALKKASLHADTRLVLQIHDELVYEVASKDVDTVIPLVVSAMEGAADMAVPLEVHVAQGDTLGTMKEIH